MELALAQEAAQNWPSFGICLGRHVSKEGAEPEDAGEPLVVAQIDRGSPADKSAPKSSTNNGILYVFRCGVLQVGDRILCINDWQTAEGSLEEVGKAQIYCKHN
jgi:S1-C subfamily serine protease